MKFVDLSHSIFNGMSTYPSDPRVSVVQEKEINKDRSLLHRFSMGTHTGTHLDSPSHIIPDGKTFDEFSLSTFTGTAVKINEKSYTSLRKLETSIDGIIYDTGWYRHFDNPKIFFGLDRPIIKRDVMNMAIDLGIKFFGCDLPSVDASGSKTKPVHHAFLKAGIIIYESLTNLDQLPLLTSFNFYGFPLPLKGLDGSPVRAVGILQ